MAFGLAGAWPASLLVRLGWHAADAYSGMVAFWLGLAMYSAYRIARGLGATRLHSVVGSTAWISRSEEHTSELQSLMRISYAVFCLKKKIIQSYSAYHNT